jgi:hypothetical protein
MAKERTEAEKFWEEETVPLELKVRVSLEAIRRTTPEVYMRMIERHARSFFAEAKALYREVHPDAVFPDEREPRPTIHISGAAVGGLLGAMLRVPDDSSEI